VAKPPPPRRDLVALHRFIDERQNRPHEWGREANDCVGFVLGAVEAMTGVKVAPKTQWTDRASAVRKIARYGSIEQRFDRHFTRIPAALAQRGDIAGVPDAEFGIHPMIVEGITLVGPCETGNRRLPRRAMMIAWSATRPKP